MSDVQVITDDEGARALAARLNGNARKKPIVVVTIAAGQSSPYVDAAHIADEVGDVSEVFLLSTGPHSWTFSGQMPDQTQVYGGAARAYPVGLDWVGDIGKSPLRFAFDQAGGARATQEIISDTLSMAASAGLFEVRAADPSRAWTSGEVVGLPHPERAMVKLDNRRLATVIPDLAAPGVALVDVLVPGMRVEGWLDPTTSRLDLRESHRAAEAALAEYVVDAPVLARVTSVESASAVLAVYPGVDVVVPLEAVTSNELDDLTSLLTPGEVLVAHVTSAGPQWGLALIDVDDDEEPLPAASVFDGGPPWLALPDPEPHQATAPPPAPSLVPSLVLPVPTEPAAPVPEPVAQPVPDPPAPPRPSPALLDRRGRATPKPAPTPRPPVPPPAPEVTAEPDPKPASGAVASLNLTLDALRSDLSRLEREVNEARSQVADLTNERNAIHADLVDQRARQARSEDELRRLRQRLRKGSRRPASAAPEAPGPEFANAEQGFRHEIVTAWATRTPLGEQAALPLPDYAIGPQFLTSVEEMTGVSRAKIADVVVEVLTGRAATNAGREVHQLRDGPPGSPYRRRPEDNAICWRVSIQVHTPQARRLHYWAIPGGGIELSRVVLHDDMEP